MSKPQIEIDPNQLTLADWETIEEIQEGKIRAKAAIEIVVRCSDWTAEQVRALPASALKDVLTAIGDALASVVTQKN